MNVNVNLMKLEGTEEIIHKDQLGIFVPYDSNNVYRGKASAYIQFYMLQKKDRYNNPYMVARSLTKQERKNKTPLTFCGSANYEKTNQKYEAKNRPEKREKKETNFNPYSKYTDEDDFV